MWPLYNSFLYIDKNDKYFTGKGAVATPLNYTVVATISKYLYTRIVAAWQ